MEEFMYNYIFCKQTSKVKLSCYSLELHVFLFGFRRFYLWTPRFNYTLCKNDSVEFTVHARLMLS